jgi:fumarylacetoacetate (FAA) hydrolase
MKLATRRDGTPDGTLLVVSRDLSRAAPASAVVLTLQAAIERWGEVEAPLRALAQAVEENVAPGLSPLDPTHLGAPLPRAWQWLDGSAYPSHGALMQQAFGLPPIETDPPLMYQGLSDRFLGPLDDVPLPSEADGIDFEGEFGVIVDEVPMGTNRMDALGHVRLLLQINDWSLRVTGAREMRTGFGWVQAKPACAMAPIAVTPDEIGDCWSQGRIALTLHTDLNGERFGRVPGGGKAMQHGFGDLIAHAARTRTLVAGTVIGSGTVSSPAHAEVGSSCIAERRAIEMIDHGAPRTPFMRFGETVRMTAYGTDHEPVFGVLHQSIVLHR